MDVITMHAVPVAPGGRLPLDRRLPGPALREVEAVLRSYPSFKAELREAQRDCLDGGYETDFNRTSGGAMSDPTASRALRLAADPHVRQLDRLVSAVDTAIAIFGEQRGLAMRLHFERGQTWAQVARALSVSEPTTTVWVRRFRVLVWEQLQRGRRRAVIN